MILNNFNHKNSPKTLVADILEIKLSHWYFLSKIYTFNNSKPYCLEQILCFILIIAFVPLWIWSYQESTVVAPIFSLALYKILFYFSWFAINTDSILKSTHICDFNRKQSVEFLNIYFCTYFFLLSNFEIRLKVKLAMIGNFPIFFFYFHFWATGN